MFASGAGFVSCDICALAGLPSSMVLCSECRCYFHRTCLGLRLHAYPGMVFACPDCLLWEAKIPHHPEGERLAAELVQLLASRLAESTDRTYSSALNRYKRFVVEFFGMDIAVGLPPQPGEGVPNRLIQFFLTHARA